MKNILKFTFALLLSLTFFYCNEENNVEKIDLVDNSENIQKLISSFDVVLKTSIKNPKLTNDKLGELFIKESKNRGLSIVEVNSSYVAKNNEQNLQYSDEYFEFSSQIQNANSFSTKEEYKTSLTILNTNVINSNISTEEKQILVDNIGFMTAFVDWMDEINIQTTNKSTFLSKSECDGWWSCWGKCVAGTLGGSITGFLEGAGIGAAIGGTIGAVGGTAASVAAGAIIGGSAGGIIGSVGGAMSGAAEHC